MSCDIYFQLLVVITNFRKDYFYYKIFFSLSQKFNKIKIDFNFNCCSLFVFNPFDFIYQIKI